MAFILQNATADGAGTPTAVQAGNTVLVSGTFGPGVYATLTATGSGASVPIDVFQAQESVVMAGPCTLNAVVSGANAGDGTSITVETV